jgi:uncharacterized protein YqeY
MSMKERLNEDLKAAMKNKDFTRRDSLRNLQAAIKQVEIDQRIEMDDEAVIKVLMSEAKKRRESIEAYERAARSDKAENERLELQLIESYLPQQLSRDEIRVIAQAVITEIGAASPKDIGKVMAVIMAKVKGKADGRVVSEVIRELLS